MQQLAKDLIKAIQSTQNPGAIQQALEDEEANLERRDPHLYDWKVNGVRHIVVKDAGIETRYIWQDGQLVNVKPGRF